MTSQIFIVENTVVTITINALQYIFSDILALASYNELWKIIENSTISMNKLLYKS